jgi:cysteine desulfurase
VDGRHYLDHASTSPLRPAARDAMRDYLDANLDGDPGRIHADGMAVRSVLEDARSSIAAALGTRSRSVVFTSSASEAIAQASVASAARDGSKPQACSAVEHSAVRHSVERAGRVHWIGCDEFGRVDVADVQAAVEDGCTAVHVQWTNHEVGTVQPITEIVERCRAAGVLLHVDATQAVGRTPIDFDRSGIDLMSMSAHKHGGPTGIGALLVRRGLVVSPLVGGAAQERGRRAGLENTLAAVGWAAALTSIDLHAEVVQQRHQSDRIAAALTAIHDVTLFGHPSERAPHLVCAGIAGIEPQGALLGLNSRGISVHSGSACASEDLQPSPVLEAMGVDAHRSLRVSVGWSTTDDDIAAFERAIGPVISDLRRLGAG